MGFVLSASRRIQASRLVKKIWCKPYLIVSRRFQASRLANKLSSAYLSCRRVSVREGGARYCKLSVY